MRDLEVLYDQVPATRCAGTGDCCALTEEEFDNYYATMFPLYRAEYVHIVAYVEQHFSPQRPPGVAELYRGAAPPLSLSRSGP